MAAIENNHPSFGVVLKTFRKRRHLTQQQLAEGVGVHRSTLIHWEQGDFLPKSKALILDLARHLHLDEQETRQLLEASLTGLAPYWSVPLLRNPYFTGREAVLEALYMQLGVEQAVTLTHSSALYGLGGVGKTQIALEYAYRYALEYSAAFWMGAEAEEQIISSFMRVIEAVQRWLSTHGQWLLIWDNVEDLDLLQRFLPSTRSDAILLTTRCQALGTLARGLDLLPMEQEEGMLFLLRRAKVVEPEATCEDVRAMAECRPTEYAVASELVTVLRGLPLALDQAGAYLEATRCGLPAYLELFRTRCTALLQQRGEGSRDHPASVSATFTLAITQTAQHHPAVQDLLRVCALLQPDAIPEELFRQAGEHLGVTLESVCRDLLDWDRVVAIACAYSLLSRQPEEQTLSLHRLVQAVLLDTMTEAEREQWIRRVMSALDRLFPDVRPATGSAIWKQCERLQPHALLCLHQAEALEESLTFASLTYKVAQYLRTRGRYTEAEPLYQRALHVREQAYGPDHSQVAPSLNDLAILCWCLGKYEQAEPLYRRALRIWEQSLGPDHPQVAALLNNLGFLYRDQGKYAEAEPHYLRALRIWEQSLGPDHPLVASALNTLALLYRDQGRYAEAGRLALQSLSIREQALGPDHPDVALSLNNLANLSWVQGQYSKVESPYLRALHIWEQTLGPDHPSLAHPLTGLADLYREQGRYAEAEAFYQRALAIREQQLDSQHPEIAETQHGLALLRKTQGNLSEAISLTERALLIRLQALGVAHPKTVASRLLYTQLVQEQEGEARADVYNAAGQADKAPRALHKEGDASSSASDPLQVFLDVCCERHPRAWCRSADLWQAYECWVERSQERYPLSRGAFIVQLKAHGCHADRTKSTRIWHGIALVRPGGDGG
jgi:tetratricopeptide (TPR) repeat protein